MFYVGEERTNEGLRLSCLSVAEPKNEQTSGMTKTTVLLALRRRGTSEKSVLAKTAVS